MKVFRLEQQQTLPVTLDEAWNFFSNPRNLNEITPGEVGFKILACDEGPMFEGQIISYRIQIAPMIWTSWVTEIKAVEEGRSFIDEQRAGPYKFWHHRHQFEAVPGGVLMTDTVNYALGFGPIGMLVHRIFVRKKLESIFHHRKVALSERFGVSKP